MCQDISAKIGGKTLYVISDLHMGDCRARDNFEYADGAQGLRQQNLEGFLNYVANKNGQLMILGDLFEFWQISIGAILIARERLMDRFRDMDVIYILGNHDGDLLKLIPKPEVFLAHGLFSKMSGPCTATINSKKFKFMHGHEIDDFNKGDEPGSGRIMAIIAGLCEDCVGGPNVPIPGMNKSVEDLLADTGTNVLDFITDQIFKDIPGVVRGFLHQGRTPTQDKARAGQMFELVRKDMASGEGYDVAIVGHTHKPGHYEDWYYNSGSWVEKEATFLEIAQNGNVRVLRWINGQATPFAPDLKNPL